MSLIDTLKNIFGKHADKLPEDMNSLDDLKNKLPDDLNSVDELKTKARDIIEQHGDVIQQVTEKIPSDKDDKLVESIKNKL